jgi:hypothetical protein
MKYSKSLVNLQFDPSRQVHSETTALFTIFFVAKYLYSINATVGAQRKPRFIGAHNMMDGTGCLHAIALDQARRAGVKSV